MTKNSKKLPTSVKICKPLYDEMATAKNERGRLFLLGAQNDIIVAAVPLTNRNNRGCTYCRGASADTIAEAWQYLIERDAVFAGFALVRMNSAPLEDRGRTDIPVDYVWRGDFGDGPYGHQKIPFLAFDRAIGAVIVPSFEKGLKRLKMEIIDQPPTILKKKRKSTKATKSTRRKKVIEAPTEAPTEVSTEVQ